MPAAVLDAPPQDPRLVALERIQTRIDQIQRAQEIIYRLNPYVLFQPNPAQYRWMQMIQGGLDEHKMKFGVFPGNSNGKTLWGVNLIQNICCPPESRNPWFSEVPFIKNWKWGKHIRLVCKADDLKDDSGMVWKLIHDWWPMTDWETQKQDHPYVSKYLHKQTGFFVSVRTFDQPIESHDDGSTIALVVFNEPPPTSVWNAYPARLREGGFLLALATLVRESQFFKDDVIDNPLAAYCLGDIHDNCRSCAKLEVKHPTTGQPVTLTGYLDHENLENLIINSPWREQEARRTGRPVHLSGAAFDIMPQVHFLEKAREPTVVPEVLPPTTDISRCVHVSMAQASGLVLDPHERRPWAILAALLDVHDNWFAVDEWPTINTMPWKLPYHKITLDTTGLAEYATILRDLKRKWNVLDRNCIIDAKFAGQWVKDDGGAHKLRETLAYKYGLRFVAGNTQVRGQGGGIRELQGALSYDKSRPVEYGNRPRIYFCKDCWNTCYQVENVVWDEKADPDEYGMKESLQERLMDFPRLCMYLLMHKAGKHKPGESAESLAREGIQKKWEAVSRTFGPPPTPSGSATSFKELAEMNV